MGGFVGDEEKVLAYIEAGCVYVVAAGYTRDALPPHDIITGLTGLTDGTRSWYSGLAHYVRKYKVALPQALIDHMEANGWAVPKVDVTRLFEA